MKDQFIRKVLIVFVVAVGELIQELYKEFYAPSKYAPHMFRLR